MHTNYLRSTAYIRVVREIGKRVYSRGVVGGGDEKEFANKDFHRFVDGVAEVTYSRRYPAYYKHLQA